MNTPHRRLVVLMDGTWQGLANNTNVGRLNDNIDDGSGLPGGGIEQEVKYVGGVGEPLCERVPGGLFGYGLTKNIKEAFYWLSLKYRPKDEVFVFGYSRGAYSARSLVGLMHKCGGLLRRPTQALVDEAYALYRDASSDATRFRAEHCVKARVRMIGVWDTVGQLGVPVSGLPLVLPGTRDYYRFHNTNLSCIVDEAYQALAIDEYREDFQPTMWSATTENNKAVEQCWFIGDHSDVGGGNPNSTLWKPAYVWMQDKAVAAGLRMKTTLTENGEWRQAPSDSFSSFLYGLFALGRLFRRYIRQIGVHVEEVLHPSVLERVQNVPQYRPQPLTNVGVPQTTSMIPRRHMVEPGNCPVESNAAPS